MIKLGLVSVAFRDLTPIEIINIAKENNLQGIQWGSDVHVPINNITSIKSVLDLSSKYNLEIFAYNSYYNLGLKNYDFNDIYNTAKKLKTKIIRVWAYNKNSEDVTDIEYKAIINDTIRICNLASDMTICLELHNKTLTNNYEATLKFIKDVNCSNLLVYWQPNQLKTFEYNTNSIVALLPYIVSIHVFNCDNENKYHLLQEQEKEWKTYFEILVNAPNLINICLEFTKDNNLCNFYKDIKMMKSMMKSIVK